MKKLTAILLALALTLALAGCSTAAASDEDSGAEAEAEAEMVGASETEAPEGEIVALTDHYLVTDVYGDGQKPWYVVLEYSTAIDPASVSADDYEIDGYTIAAVYTSAQPSIPEESAAGCYVLLEMSTDYTTSNYGGSSSSGIGNASGGRGTAFSGGTDSLTDDSGSTELASGEITGDRTASAGLEGSGEVSDESYGTRDDSSSGGQGMVTLGVTGSNQLTVTFTQTGEITSADGDALAPDSQSYSTNYEENINLLVENFTLYTMTLSDGTTMMYSLYLPEDYNEDTVYPLVLFMPDATGEGSDEYLALTESLGGVIWTTEEWQSEHETIVLVPQYENGNTSDPAYTMELVSAIEEVYSVDTTREYLVGQSSGTIRSIKLLIDYPDQFAGALLVAGQTDSAYTDQMAALATANIWMICSAGDARAYPGMTEITEAVEAEGTEVTIAQWSAMLSDEEQEALAAEQAAAGTSINWTIFDAETVMRDDVTPSDATEHMNTWRVAYDLNTVREWLFQQTT
ncbi:MAG: hypothetical protein LUH36_04995 [Oscillospiraceae bacterium]|nr:hypothetical protein [Oscillospiraceae bacterium]